MRGPSTHRSRGLNQKWRQTISGERMQKVFSSRCRSDLRSMCSWGGDRRGFLVGSLAAVALAGCASVERLPPAAANVTDQTTVLGIPNARFYADTQVAEIVQEALRAVERERAANPGSGGRLPPAHFLGLSGGSDNGAFGAGLLVGWSEAGTRPEFKLVSGVSTGALIAPFAFL